MLEATFTLGDAQELVARKHGFDSWAALIEGLPTMTSPTPPRTASIIAAEPQLFVADMAAACAFYVEKLGFELAFSDGEPPFYTQLSRDGARLNLRKVAGLVFDISFRTRERDALSCTFAVDDAKLLFFEFEKAGVAFHQPLRTEPWGARTFIVQDPDGNLICFAGG